MSEQSPPYILTPKISLWERTLRRLRPGSEAKRLRGQLERLEEDLRENVDHLHAALGNVRTQCDQAIEAALAAQRKCDEAIAGTDRVFQELRAIFDNMTQAERDRIAEAVRKRRARGLP